ncbi:MAG TPA: N-acetyl-gamma-glutamyl-phosphate reductase [Terriglobales bacterium]|nr:N-acetyl-gamma-glutamyl-phosphate reductase [Terriglobales bacterium]
MNKYSSTRVAVAGAAGYAGRELLERLARHPGVELAAAVGSGRGAAATPVAELAPAYHGRLQVEPGTPDTVLRAGAEVVFLATPAEVSTEWVAGLGEGVRVIDLSGAYRFTDAAVYGWPEKNRDAIRGARLVANPGCYATAAVTALWPLLAAGAIEENDIICDAKSGASGAGRGLRDDLHFVELEGNCKAYSVYQHRHAPEIARHAGMGAAGAARFTFAPHLLPTSRGILATTYVKLNQENLGEIYDRAYAGRPFVRLRGARLPELNDVVRTNFCDLGWSVRAEHRQAIIVTCLDNLVKGAAGQALQNFNLMTGWPEETALL